MQISHFQQMDPDLLYSLINMKLRNDYSSLARLCQAMDINEAALITKLSSAGYQYQSAQNQFRPT
ncbi:DUF4250 domain-containing protein [Corallincola holothuriorum]|uniref:DUF4250 domain-containing protein n=2 Tax=Corallincola holothuriorum TaxID=2282215 RepID=A0A368NHP0_9GAMM|nr:DUF4250 domain-containing protein [Corallincola holothuriorum]